MKKILSFGFALCFALALVCGVSNVHAEDDAIPQGADFVSSSLSVSDVTSTKTDYKAGETITGSFRVVNDSSFDLTKLVYRIQIGAEYDDSVEGYKFPETFLDVSDIKESFEVSRGSSKTLTYSYKIPSFLSGEKLAVHIAVFADDGRLLGWGDGTYFNIEKANASLTITKAEVRLSDGKSFELGDGPTIYKDKAPENASLLITVQNPGKADVTVTPALATRLQTDTRPAKFNNLAPVVVKAGGSETLKIELSNMSYQPGIYMADVILSDGNGNQLTSRIGARYIVGGDIATVHDAYVDKTAFEIGESFHFSARITGEAPDIAAILSGQVPEDRGQGKVDITIFNKNGDVVAQSREDVALSGETKIEKDYTAANSANALRLQMQVYNEDGALIQDYITNLSTDFDSAPLEEAAPNAMDLKVIFALIGCLAIIIIGIIAFMARRRMSRRETIVSIVALCILATYPVSVLASCASAGVSFTAITTPANQQKMSAGQTFMTSGAVSYNACQNNPSNITSLTATLQGRRLNASSIGGTWAVGKAGGTGWYPVAAMFRAGPFIAPTTPGTYTITYNVSYVAGSCSGSNVAYRQIKVATPPANLYGGGCSTGQYYCDITGRCTPNTDMTCNKPGDYEAFKINMKIPALIGPVKLKNNLTAKPPIVNKGFSCTVDWSSDFVSYDNLTVCTFSAPGITVEFSPGDEDAETSATINNVQGDVPYKITCRESDDLTPPDTDEGVCRLNWQYKEVN